MGKYEVFPKRKEFAFLNAAGRADRKVRFSLLDYLGRRSIRKPIAWFTFWFICAVVAGCLIAFGDIPPGAKDILVWMCGIPVAVVGSSSWEAIKGVDENVEEGSGTGGADDNNHPVRDTRISPDIRPGVRPDEGNSETD